MSAFRFPQFRGASRTASSIKRVSEANPQLTRSDIEAALAYAAEVLRQETLLPLATRQRLERASAHKKPRVLTPTQIQRRQSRSTPRVTRGFRRKRHEPLGMLLLALAQIRCKRVQVKAELLSILPPNAPHFFNDGICFHACLQRPSLWWKPTAACSTALVAAKQPSFLRTIIPHKQYWTHSFRTQNRRPTEKVLYSLSVIWAQQDPANCSGR